MASTKIIHPSRPLTSIQSPPVKMVSTKTTVHTETYVGTSSHALQTVDIWVQNSSTDAPWLIYVHGGAWRDPKITKSTGYTLIQKALSNPSLNAATIDYRLSPHPSYPDEDNHAVHPDHLNDVLSALLYLKASHGLSAKRYVLVGHSAGAALVFQVLTKLSDHSFFPAAIIGASGVYDFVDIIEEYPNYLCLITAPFGEDKEAWKGASPTWIGRESAGYADYTGKIALLHSDNDEFLSWRQTRGFRNMVDALPGREDNKALIVTAKGKHDQVPEGKEIVDTVELLLANLIH